MKISLQQSHAICLFLLLSSSLLTAQTAGVVQFNSSDKSINQSFNWAKNQALSSIHRTDPVGLWYNASEINSESFSIRGATHQSMGAAILGLDDFTKNMFLKFARNMTLTKDYCSYSRINRYNKPVPLDYRNDKDFKYHLPANFDLVYNCYRQYLWTGDKSYLSNPTFLNFYTTSLNQYVDRWQLSHDKISTRDRLINLSKPRVPSNTMFFTKRGMPTYYEGTSREPLMGIDMTASLIAAYEAYANINAIKQNASASFKYENQVVKERQFLKEFWWDKNRQTFKSIYYDKSNFDYFMVGKDEAYLHYLLYFNVLDDDSKIKNILTKYQKNYKLLKVEHQAYLPVLMYKNGFSETANQILTYLTSKKNPRQNYPEVAFSVIEHLTMGLMGIEVNAPQKMITTRSNLDGTMNWAEMSNIPVFSNQISVKHEGNHGTTFKNQSNNSIKWRVEFKGNFPQLFVDGGLQKAEYDVVEEVSYIILNLMPNSEISVKSSLQPAKADLKYRPHWKITNDNSIRWDLRKDQNLPYNDNIEMAGKKVAGIIDYTITAQKEVKIERHIIFPQMHIIPAAQPAWAKYRAYLRDTLTDDEVLPIIKMNGRIVKWGQVEEVMIDGELKMKQSINKQGLKLTRRFLPSMDDPLFIENWTIKNTSNNSVVLNMAKQTSEKLVNGQNGLLTISINNNGKTDIKLRAKESYSFSIMMSAHSKEKKIVDIIGDKKEEPGKPIAPSLSSIPFADKDVFQSRKAFLDTISKQLVLITPQPILNTLFKFSKIRAAESIFETDMGLVHSPGGGRYYGGVWANDQAEYSGPFFPYLGYKTGNIAALNAYKQFYEEMKTIPRHDKNISASFEMGGKEPCCGTDRGDAAMVAYGGAHYLLALGDQKIAQEYFPMIKWALEYCHKNLNREGVVMSDSDEMEGRIETGKANLSTSALYYGGLRLAIHLCKELNMPLGLVNKYEIRSKALATSIEKYFGANVEGLNTYKYYKGHQNLRHWICLPLVVGLHDRKEATIKGLLDRLWGKHGVYVERNNPATANIFWDRGTLYALRGTLIAGETEASVEKLMEFSKERLLGLRVPYVVEAYPEGGMAHLSAESALYCRIFIEGMFGLEPVELNGFSLTPRLPKGWAQMQLKNVHAFGTKFHIEILRQGSQQMLVTVRDLNRQQLYKKIIKDGEKAEFYFEE